MLREIYISFLQKTVVPINVCLFDLYVAMLISTRQRPLFVFSRLVDYLDESLPGSFRQAQVCFSSLIPKAVPTCDAVTMEPYLWLYCDYGRLKHGSLLESDDSGTGSATDSRYHVSPAYTANAMGRNSAGRSDNMLTPNVLMLTKHTNGSLNLWQVADIIFYMTCCWFYCNMNTSTVNIFCFLLTLARVQCSKLIYVIAFYCAALNATRFWHD